MKKIYNTETQEKNKVSNSFQAETAIYAWLPYAQPKNKE